MNIFVLDELPSAAARYHCDKHVVKMVLETAQLLSTAHFIAAPDNVCNVEGVWAIRGQRVCKPTHANHPCSVWTRTSADNYAWLQSLGVALCAQYTRRYERQHLFEPMLCGVLAEPPASLPCGATPHAQAMPDCYKNEDAVHAYRLYYACEKLRFARWRRNAPPPWLDEYVGLADKLVDFV